MSMIIFSKDNGIIDRRMFILPIMSPLIYAAHVKLDHVQSLVFRPRARGFADDLRCKVKGTSNRFPNYSGHCPCLSVQSPVMSVLCPILQLTISTQTLCM